MDVARSIERLSLDRGYGIIGKPDLNRWWGRAGSKWAALSADGAAANYFTDEISLLHSYESKGAYEWLVSLAEVDRWRDRLGDRLLEITYDELTENPEKTLRQICQFLSLSVPQRWFAASVRQIDKARRNFGVPPGSSARHGRGVQPGAGAIRFRQPRGRRNSPEFGQAPNRHHLQ